MLNGQGNVTFLCKVLMKQPHVDNSQVAHKEERRGKCDQLMKDEHLDMNYVNEGLVEWDQRMTKKHVEEY